MSFFGIVGACFSVYVGIRLAATVVDIIQRWRHNDWEV
jgi:hypothetical protein